MARRLLLALLAGLLAGGAALAAMPQVAPDLPGARMAGQGTFTWFGMKIYDASLWVGEAGYAPGAPFALELHYARALSGARIAEASADQMEKTGGGTAAQRALWLEQMRAVFPDVKEGSRITGVFLPGGAVRFHLGASVLGTIAEPGFAQAFAGIWLGPRTTAPRLREALLREAARR
ncbi:chalcone isomerase family protein [Massilia sp. GCM10020059]|uniref:Chalcone isomerase family protein n=1 Tax=Massilia agrisoli TaxID=2892444 RepID=A0ABS8IR02_9BURK|nr:chalcone isomerase family protein [Massilia agrisoli]MCC6069715.1 chalcone isomerase family protein [Massilia agrisoli]